MKVFSYDFGVSDIVHFPLFEVPWELCLNEGRYCNKQTPLYLLISSTSCYWGKEVLEKMILVLISPWKVLDFFPQKILYEPCFHT